MQITTSLLRQFITEAFPDSISNKPTWDIHASHAGHLRTLVDRLKDFDHPPLKGDPVLAMELEVAANSIKEKLALWSSMGPGTGGPLAAVPGQRNRNPIQIILDVLKKCEDMSRSEETSKSEYGTEKVEGAGEDVSRHKLVFVSHKESDQEIAQELVGFLLASLELEDSELRCTSVPGHKLAFGESIPEQLKGDLHLSAAVIALLTSDSLESSWVLFELGAAWALDKLVVPILGPGLKFDDLPGPLRDRPAVLIEKDDAAERIRDAVQNIAQALNIEEKTGGKPQAHLDRFVKRFRASTPSSSTSVRPIIISLVEEFSKEAPPTIFKLFGNIPGGYPLKDLREEIRSMENDGLVVTSPPDTYSNGTTVRLSKKTGQKPEQ